MNDNTDMIEFDTGGVSNFEIINEGQQHLPIVLLLDLSGSMRDYTQELTDALEELKDSLEGDPVTRSRAEVMLIAFSDEAHIVAPFSPIDDLVIPKLVANGCTNMHGAVDVAIGELQIRREQYLRRDVSSYKPIMFLLTDGRPTCADNGAFRRLMDLQKNDKWNYIPVAIGPYADTEFLAENNAAKSVLVSGVDNFDGTFSFIADSLSTVAKANPGDAGALPNVADYGMSVQQVAFNA